MKWLWVYVWFIVSLFNFIKIKQFLNPLSRTGDILSQSCNYYFSLYLSMRLFIKWTSSLIWNIRTRQVVMMNKLGYCANFNILIFDWRSQSHYTCLVFHLCIIINFIIMPFRLCICCVFIPNNIAFIFSYLLVIKHLLCLLMVNAVHWLLSQTVEDICVVCVSMEPSPSRSSQRDFSIQLDTEEEWEALILDPKQHVLMRTVSFLKYNT